MYLSKLNKIMTLKPLEATLVEPSTPNSTSGTTYALVEDSGGEGAVTGACAGDKSVQLSFALFPQIVKELAAPVLVRFAELELIRVLTGGSGAIRATLTMQRYGFFAYFLCLRTESRSHRRRGMTLEELCLLRGETEPALFESKKYIVYNEKMS